MPKALRLCLEFAAYAAALAIFFWSRTPFLPAWWFHFHSDWALVGTMAQATLGGHFPIFYYGQNYMGGAEWATAALLTKLWGAAEVTVDILRWNSVLWWAAAGAAWVFFLRGRSVRLSVAFAFLYALGNYALFLASPLQEQAVAYVFFSALLLWALWRTKDLGGVGGFLFGLIAGLAWWTNQTVIFFLLPALWVRHAQPGGWWQHPLARELRRPERKLRIFYALASSLAFVGFALALYGPLRIELGGGRHFKLPNGLKLTRDCLLVILALQVLVKLVPRRQRELRRAALELARRAAPLAAGFLLGYAPVWLGRLLRLYEKGYGVGFEMKPLLSWPAEAGALLHAVDGVWFSGLFNAALGAYSLPAVLAAVAALGAAAYLRWQNPLARCAAYAVGFNLLYVFFSSRTFGAPWRYLYTSLIGAWILALLFLLGLRPRWRASLLTILLLGGAVVVSRRDQARMHGEIAATAWRATDIEETIRSLEKRGSPYCWGDYWTAYLLNYLSHGRLQISPHPQSPAIQIRMPELAAAVEKENPRCYVSREGNEWLSKLRITESNPWLAP